MPSFHLFAESCKYHGKFVFLFKKIHEYILIYNFLFSAGDVLDCLTLNLFLSDNSILGVEHHKSGLQETNVQENKHVHVDLIKNPSYYCENDTSTVCCCLLGIPQEFNLKVFFLPNYISSLFSFAILRNRILTTLSSLMQTTFCLLL